MPGFREFVLLIAGLMSMNALAIDAMVPALAAIGMAFQVDNANHPQWVVSAYLLGFGFAQLVYGPLADRFGRRPVLVGGVGLYTLLALLCSIAGSFELLLVARFMQGGAAAATRILVVAVVRDRYEGAAMARLMSLAMMVFLIAPMVAPVIGQVVLLFASWRWIFLVLAGIGAAMLVWVWVRLPETLRENHRRLISPGSIVDGFRQTLTKRLPLGYGMVMVMMLGALTGYIISIQQIVFDTFGQPEMISLAFIGVAAQIAVASWLNSQLVTRFGPAAMVQAALILFTLVAGLHWLVALSGESLAMFVGLHGLTLAFFGIASANANALAMQPLGHIAGTASSVQGLMGTVCGATLGTLIGQAYDGTQIPLIAGTAALGFTAMAIAVVTERGLRIGRERS
ncbi:MAG: multidrug effflux MFS transporter [Sphingosinicella sp.]